MNIFEILSQGKGSVNEENISAFLAYLLNPNETHGLRNEFLKRFIKLAGEKSSNIALSNLELREYDSINIELEKCFSNDECKNNRKVDIMIYLKNDAELTIIGIENKIKSESCQDNQLKEEYTNICNKYKNYNEQNVNIYMLFAIPFENNTTSQEYNNLETENKAMLQWADITSILVGIINDEQQSKISPISTYVRQTIQAFVYYMSNDYKKISNNKTFNMWWQQSQNIESFRLIQYKDGSSYIKLLSTQESVKQMTLIGGFVKYYMDMQIDDEKFNPKWNTHTIIKKFINIISSDQGIKLLEKYNELHSNK